MVAANPFEWEEPLRDWYREQNGGGGEPEPEAEAHAAPQRLATNFFKCLREGSELVIGGEQVYAYTGATTEYACTCQCEAKIRGCMRCRLRLPDEQVPDGKIVTTVPA